MKRKLVLGIVLVLVTLLISSCGIPQEEHDAVVAERDSAQSQVKSLQSKLTGVEGELDTTNTQLETAQSTLETVQGELETTKSEFQSLESQLSSANSRLQSTNSQLSSKKSQLASLVEKVELSNQILKRRTAYLRAYKADSGSTEQKELYALQLSIFKSYDPLVNGIGDTELIKHWGGTWPEGARQDSEEAGRPLYVTLDYANFLERLAELIEADME